MATKTKNKKNSLKSKKTDSQKLEKTSVDTVFTSSKTNTKLKFSKKYWILLILLLFAGTVYLGRGLFVAATINGYPITRFQIIKELEKESGKRVLENIVTKELINQEAKKRNITVSDTEVDAQIEEIKKSLETQGTNLDAALQMQGQSLDTLKGNIKLQKYAEKLLEDKTKVTEEEVKKYFDENKETFSKDQTYDSIKSQIESQLKAQKFQSEIEKFLTDLKNQYKINYFVTY